MTDASFQVWEESNGGDLCKSTQSHSGGTDLLEPTELRAAEAAWVNPGIFVKWGYDIRALDKFQLAEICVIPLRYSRENILLPVSEARVNSCF